MGLNAIPVWIVRRIGRQSCALLVITAVFAAIAYQRHSNIVASGSPRPPINSVRSNTGGKDISDVFNQVNIEPPQKDQQPNHHVHEHEQEKTPIVVVPTEPLNNAHNKPTDSTPPVKKSNDEIPRTDYQWLWVTDNGEREVMVMDAFVLWRNSSGVSVGVLAEGMFDSVTFPTKTTYETDMQCVWDDGTKSNVPEINFLYRMKVPSEKRVIAYTGPDNTLTKPFHDYYRTHRIHCDHANPKAILKGLARQKTAWKLDIPKPPVEKIPPSKDRLSICLSPLFASSNSRWLIEWMEYHRHAGVSKVHVPMYHDVSEPGAAAFWTIINRYADMGFAVITPWSPKVSKRATEINNVYEHGKILAWNACWLQFKDSVDWLAFVDIDEVLAGSGSDVTFDKQLDYADSEFKEFGKIAYSIRSSTVASMFNEVETYSISQRLLMDEYSETELKQFCQGVCGKYHHSRDKLLLRARPGAALGRPEEIPLVMMWTHAIGGNDYNYADMMMKQLDKSIFYLKHFNGWWLLRDKPSNKRLLEWQPERMERRDDPVPAERLFLMQKTIENDSVLKKLYLESYAKKSPDWLDGLIHRLDKRTFHPPWTVNSTCAKVLNTVKSDACHVLHSPSQKVAVVQLPGSAPVEAKFHAKFSDATEADCSSLPADTKVGAFITDPVEQYIVAYTKAIEDTINKKAKETPELIANDIGDTTSVDAYWSRGKVAQTVFEKYTHQIHHQTSASAWSDHFTLQSSILANFDQLYYIGKADDKLVVSWDHFLSNLGVSDLFPTGGYESQDHDTKSTSLGSIKAQHLTQRTIDTICTHVRTDLPCLRSSFCDLSWMRPAIASRSLLSTTVSVEKASECKKQVDAFFKIGAMQSHCPQSTWLERMREVDGAPDKNVIIVGCNKGFDAMKIYERWDAANVVFRLEDWKHKLAKHGMDKCGRCGGCLVDDIKTHGDREKYSRHHLKSPKVFCIEPLPSNFDILQKVYTELKYGSWHGGQVPSLQLINAAASDTLHPATVKFPKVMEPGQENVGIDFRDKTSIDKLNTGGEMVDINTTTVDAITKQYKLDKVDILMIDAEGHDPLILEGAYSTIRRLNVRYVEFENHSVGQWANASIKDSIDAMDDHGFDCYWAGHRQLWPITRCWSDRYEEHKQWSNIVCAKRFDPWHAVLEEFVMDS